MEPRTRAVVIPALLALLVAFAGCATDGGGSDLNVSNAPSAQALQENATAQMQGVETATFTVDMSISTPSQNVTMTADGVMDLPKERMRMALQLSAPQNVQVTQYVVGETAYFQYGDRWETQNLSGQNLWGQTNQLDMQRAILANSSVEVTGTDTVNGNPVWVVSLEPDSADLQTLLARQAGTTDIGADVAFSNVTVTQYVDAETSHVRRIGLTMDLTAEGQTSTVDMTMTFDGFNEPVTIELPEGAPA